MKKKKKQKGKKGKGKKGKKGKGKKRRRIKKMSSDDEDDAEKDPGEVITCITICLSLCARKPAICVLTRSDTNRPVQSQNKARSLKFWI